MMSDRVWQLYLNELSGLSSVGAGDDVIRSSVANCFAYGTREFVAFFVVSTIVF